jgi:pimeloyl-ACP methyl ester carboxylesterase
MFFIIAAATAWCSRWAELDVFGAGLGQRYVAGRKVERIARFGGFLVAGEAEGQLAPEHIAPVRAAAAVAGQPGARHMIENDCGHFPWLERPGSVRRALQSICS